MRREYSYRRYTELLTNITRDYPSAEVLEEIFRRLRRKKLRRI
jgi:hypothetical protein